MKVNLCYSGVLCLPAGNNVHRGHLTKTYGFFSLMCVRTSRKSLPQLQSGCFRDNEKQADDLARPLTARKAVNISLLQWVFQTFPWEACVCWVRGFGRGVDDVLSDLHSVYSFLLFFGTRFFHTDFKNASDCIMWPTNLHAKKTLNLPIVN